MIVLRRLCTFLPKGSVWGHSYPILDFLTLLLIDSEATVLLKEECMCHTHSALDSLALSLIHSEETVNAVMQAACSLLEAQPDLSPRDAVEDVLQVYGYVQERLCGPRQ